MEMTTSDKKCLDIESPFERPDKNYSVLKNTPLDEPIYSHFEFHITKETKGGVVSCLTSNYYKKILFSLFSR